MFDENTHIHVTAASPPLNENVKVKQVYREPYARHFCDMRGFGNRHVTLEAWKVSWMPQAPRVRDVGCP